MKLTLKKLIAAALLTASSIAYAGPSEAECEITSAVDSPLATFFKLPVIIANPAAAFVFAASSYRNSQCARPTLLTQEQVMALIAQELQRQGSAPVPANQTTKQQVEVHFDE